jgi:putative ABC transport system substrate-binding protein
MTGVANLSVETAAKQLELLHELVPSATVIALLINPNNPILGEILSKNLREAGPRNRKANPRCKRWH